MELQTRRRSRDSRRPADLTCTTSARLIASKPQAIFRRAGAPGERIGLSKPPYLVSEGLLRHRLEARSPSIEHLLAGLMQVCDVKTAATLSCTGLATSTKPSIRGGSGTGATGKSLTIVAV